MSTIEPVAATSCNSRRGCSWHRWTPHVDESQEDLEKVLFVRSGAPPDAGPGPHLQLHVVGSSRATWTRLSFPPHAATAPITSSRSSPCASASRMKTSSLIASSIALPTVRRLGVRWCSRARPAEGLMMPAPIEDDDRLRRPAPRLRRASVSAGAANAPAAGGSGRRIRVQMQRGLRLAMRRSHVRLGGLGFSSCVTSTTAARGARTAPTFPEQAAGGRACRRRRARASCVVHRGPSRPGSLAERFTSLSGPARRQDFQHRARSSETPQCGAECRSCHIFGHVAPPIVFNCHQ